MSQKSARPKSAPTQESKPVNDTNTGAHQAQGGSADLRFAWQRVQNPLPPLDPFVDRICELAADLILSGGHSDDMSLFLSGLVGHEYRRRASHLKAEADLRQDLAEVRHDAVRRWERKLGRFWADPDASQADEQAAVKSAKQSISAAVRETVRTELRERFSDFMDKANAEEIRLLRDIFISQESISHGDERDVPLAEAFSYEVGLNVAYLRVSGRHQQLVEKYIELLESSEAAA